MDKHTCSSCSVSFTLLLSLFVVVPGLFTCLFTVVAVAGGAVADEALPVICSIACINLLLGPNNLVAINSNF